MAAATMAALDLRRTPGHSIKYWLAILQLSFRPMNSTRRHVGLIANRRPRTAHPEKLTRLFGDDDPDRLTTTILAVGQDS
jgi:hypothetical protein